MIKIDLVRKISERKDCSLKESEEFLNIFLDEVVTTLARHEKLILAGFGIFEVRFREAKTGRNPKNGEAVAIPATYYPAFKPGKLLREQVKKSGDRNSPKKKFSPNSTVTTTEMNPNHATETDTLKPKRRKATTSA